MTIKIAKNLQMLRKEKGLTQEQLAEIFGITNQSISKWELSLSCPDITMLPKIAEFYSITIDELIGLTAKAISRWENSTYYPDITLLPILANIFKISVDELLDENIYK